MTKEKMDSLKKYKAELQNKLADKEIPSKHKGHPESYKTFLTNELKAVSTKISDALMAATPNAK